MPYTIDNFSITRLDTVGTTPVAGCAGCHQDTLDMTAFKASSNLNSGTTPNGNDILHNGITWRTQASAAVSLCNQAIKVVNSGYSSEGVLALPSPPCRLWSLGGCAETSCKHSMRSIVYHSPSIGALL